MNKTIFGGSLLSLLFLLIGTFAFPSSLIMELASMSVMATVVRVALALVLLVVLFSNPPRRLAVRLAMGASALACFSLGLVLSFSNGMHILDALLFLEIGIAFGIEALELNEDEILERAARLQADHANTTPRSSLSTIALLGATQ